MNHWDKAKETLSKITRLPSTEIQKIAEGVIANNRKLADCTRHDFFKTAGDSLKEKYVCKHCGGMITHNQHHWYMRGLKDALT